MKVKKGFLQKLVLSPHYMGKAGNRQRVPTCDENVLDLFFPPLSFLLSLTPNTFFFSSITGSLLELPGIREKRIVRFPKKKKQKKKNQTSSLELHTG